jgi:hypothetical protein
MGPLRQLLSLHGITLDVIPWKCSLKCIISDTNRFWQSSGSLSLSMCDKPRRATISWPLPKRMQSGFRPSAASTPAQPHILAIGFLSSESSPSNGSNAITHFHIFVWAWILKTQHELGERREQAEWPTGSTGWYSSIQHSLPTLTDSMPSHLAVDQKRSELFHFHILIIS